MESIYRDVDYYRIIRLQTRLLECVVDRSISFELQRQKMIQVLKENRPESFLSFLHHALLEKKELYILETLDQGKGRGEMPWGRAWRRVGAERTKGGGWGG